MISRKNWLTEKKISTYRNSDNGVEESDETNANENCGQETIILTIGRQIDISLSSKASKISKSQISWGSVRINENYFNNRKFFSTFFVKKNFLIPHDKLQSSDFSGIWHDLMIENEKCDGGAKIRNTQLSTRKMMTPLCWSWSLREIDFYKRRKMTSSRSLRSRCWRRISWSSANDNAWVKLILEKIKSKMLTKPKTSMKVVARPWT